jgi:hypothetical protein
VADQEIPNPGDALHGLSGCFSFTSLLGCSDGSRLAVDKEEARNLPETQAPSVAEAVEELLKS